MSKDGLFIFLKHYMSDLFDKTLIKRFLYCSILASLLDQLSRIKLIKPDELTLLGLSSPTIKF